MIGWAVGAALRAAGRPKNLDRWLPDNLFRPTRRHPPGKPVEVLIAVCDHFEPRRGNASAEKAKARLDRWTAEYPRLFADFRDSGGVPPQHTYFYPIDEYDPGHADRIAALCRTGLGEMEVHYHHDADTADNLRRALLDFKRTLADRHGVLGRDKQTGEPVYAFIHGNWALDNSRPDGRWCGVNNELDVLRETGCYADFTLPSAPSDTQTRTVNSIYWAVDDPARPKSHDTGVRLGTAPRPADGLLMIQGPLLLDWGRRKWGLMPGIENADLTHALPPDGRRLGLWLRAGVHVPTRPEWVFVKLHTHGLNEPNQDALLGEPMVRFHEVLRDRATRDPLFRYHYVTAREMANLALAAEAGTPRTVAEARSFRYEGFR
ncbi:MAG: hypothetical protein K2X87_14730 [Gemmataceae bacterium]|nr:hypothetical protein [Gemmataceae bacterium]